MRCLKCYHWNVRKQGKCAQKKHKIEDPDGDEHWKSKRRQREKDAGAATAVTLNAPPSSTLLSPKVKAFLDAGPPGISAVTVTMPAAFVDTRTLGIPQVGDFFGWERLGDCSTDEVDDFTVVVTGSGDIRRRANNNSQRRRNGRNKPGTRRVER